MKKKDAGRIGSIALLLAMLLIPSLRAADIISGTLACWSTVPMDLTLSTGGGMFNGPIYAMIALMAVLVALAYMAGTAFSKPEWTVWAKTEGVTLAWSIALVGVVLMAFSSSCTISNALLGGRESLLAPGSSAPTTSAPFVDATLAPHARASQYMGMLLNSYGVTVASDLVQSSVKDQLGSLNYAYWSIPVLDGGGLAFTANKRAWSAHKELLADIYLPLMTSILTQKLVMDIGMPGVAGIILPAAIMFRMFFLTREIGNFLLAFAFAAYFALPLTYVFFFDATAAVQKNVFLVSSDPMVASLHPFGALTIGSDDIVGDSMQRVGFMATQAIIAPNLAIVVTVTMVMALNKAFRGMAA